MKIGKKKEGSKEARISTTQLVVEFSLYILRLRLWKIVRKWNWMTRLASPRADKRNSLLKEEKLQQRHYFFLDLDQSDSWKIETRRRRRRRIVLL
jgi:hypothetical protein